MSFVCFDCVSPRQLGLCEGPLIERLDVRDNWIQEPFR